jgi:hypothetical protein
MREVRTDFRRRRTSADGTPADRVVDPIDFSVWRNMPSFTADDNPALVVVGPDRRQRRSQCGPNVAVLLA